MLPDEGVPLPGGNMGVVVRDGNAVRRVAGPWTPLVHRLLNALRSQGLTLAPAPLGIVGDHELVEFVVGEVGIYPMPTWVWADELLVDVARSLRRLHDASAALDLPREGWKLPAVEPVECICHSDVAPYNVVCRDARVVAFIDWDYAVPAPRLWDVGYAAYRWVSLTPPGHPDGHEQTPEEQRRRLNLFCDAYGADPVEVAAWAARRLDHLVALAAERASDGDPDFAATIEAGHSRLYEGDAAWIRRTFDLAR